MKPEPFTTEICRSCDQLWSLHLALRERRIRRVYDEHWPKIPLVEDFDEVGVTYLDCIHLLKSANRGPTGPVGPQGPAGLNGR